MNQRNGSKQLVFESEDAEFAKSIFSSLMNLRSAHSLSGGLKMENTAQLPDAVTLTLTRLGNYEDAKGSLPQDLCF